MSQTVMELIDAIRQDFRSIKSQFTTGELNKETYLNQLANLNNLAENIKKGHHLLEASSLSLLSIQGQISANINALNEQPEPKASNVNHPSHYNQIGVECIDVVRHFNFNRGNAIKYIWRAGSKNKDTEIEDLEKAIWYLQDEIKRLGS